MQADYPPEAFLDVPELLAPRLSPDGERVALLGSVDGRRELFVADADGDPVQVTDGHLAPRDEGRDVRWTPGGDALLFVGPDGADPHSGCLYRATPGGDVTPVAALDGRQRLFAVGRDGDAAYVGGFDALYRLDVATGERTPVGPQEMVVTAGRAPDDDRLAFDARDPDDPGAGAQNWLAEPGADPVHVPAGDPDHGTAFVAWDPDGEGWLVHDHATGEGLRVALDGAVRARFDPDGGRPVGVLADGRAVALEGDELAVYDGADCETRVPVPDDGPVREAHVAADRVAVRTGGAAGERHGRAGYRRHDGPPAVLVYDASAGEWTAVERRGSPVAADAMVAPETTTYESSTSDDPGEVRVFRPDETPAPALAVVYGPTPGATRDWDRWAQYLAHRGYAVVAADLPGDGYAAHQEDVAALNGWLRDREWVDGDRVALFGHSNGGYAAALQLLTREGWAAGLVRAAPLCFRSFAEREGTPGWAVAGVGADPEEDPARWDDLNPVQQVSGLTAPLRIHHGEYDDRGTPAEARRFRDALRDAGHVEGEDFEYHTLRGRGHLAGDANEAAAELALLENFLDRRL